MKCLCSFRTGTAFTYVLVLAGVELIFIIVTGIVKYCNGLPRKVFGRHGCGTWEHGLVVDLAMLVWIQ